MRFPALVLLIAACTPEAPSAPQATHRLVPEPTRAHAESPPVSTLWTQGEHGWQAQGRVLALAADGRAIVDADRRLFMGERVVAEGVLPDLRASADGAVYFTQAQRPPVSDIWRYADGALLQITHDGRSDRPFPLPDGRLLWVSGEGGRAGFVLDGRRLTNGPGEAFVPVPAHAAKTRFEAGRVLYDAGDAQWWLDLESGTAGPR
jgi:hypothetical protein